MKKIVIPIIIATLISFLAIYLIKNSKHFIYSGTIEATKVDISSRISSVIASYNIKEGDSVQKESTLIKLACEDIELDSQISERDYQRGYKLVRSGSIPQETYDHLKNKRDDAALKLSWCSIKSPLKGTVLNTYKEAGEWVAPGTKLLTLADLEEVWAMIYVPQDIVVKFQLGMKIKAQLPELPGKYFEGHVSKISNEAEFTPKNVQTREERTRLVFGIKITFPNSENILKPGMTIETELREEFFK